MDSMRSNNNCNAECMVPDCQYDTNTDATEFDQIFPESDCAPDCPCSVSELGDGNCNTECDIYECAYDLGDCACPCSDSQLGDLVCDPDCNIEDCNFSIISINHY